LPEEFFDYEHQLLKSNARKPRLTGQKYNHNRTINPSCHYYTMEMSCTNEASRSKSTTDHSQKQQLSLEAAALLTEIGKITSADRHCLPDIIARLTADFRSFL